MLTKDEAPQRRVATNPLKEVTHSRFDQYGYTRRRDIKFHTMLSEITRDDPRPPLLRPFRDTAEAEGVY